MILRVQGKRWFNSRCGNSYFSAKAYMNGELVGDIDYQYGYGDQYLQAMMDHLEKKGLLKLKVYSNNIKETAWRWAERNNAKLYHEVVQVPRKKDL